MDTQINQVSQVLQAFQAGYTSRDLSKLDEFMQLFVPDSDVELIGTGASARGQGEWCQGIDQVRQVIASDWKYWGDVRLDIGDVKITVIGDVAWLSTSGVVLQSDPLFGDEANQVSLKHLSRIVGDETLTPKERLVEAAHFSVRRWREWGKPTGYPWPFTYTAVLVNFGGRWRFHTIHWSMPVD